MKTDDVGRMICKDLEEKILSAIEENKRPFYVNATAGTTVLGAFDDLNAIADICLKYNLWMHVDVSIELSMFHTVLFYSFKPSKKNSRPVLVAA